MNLEKTRTELLHQINQAQLIALVAAGLMERPLAGAIAAALEDIRNENAGSADYLRVEAALIERVGVEGSNLHLGRSRNDIGATAERMGIRPALHAAYAALLELRKALLEKASAHVNTIIPAYTHGRAAQPTTFAHYLLALGDSLGRDCERLAESYRRLNLSPLGSGALSTSGFRLDRSRLAESLGFAGLVENSYDAVGIAPGDSKQEIAAAVLTSSLTLSRFAQDLILYTMDEIGFLALNRGQVGGSSIMPQKRNPGSLEKARSEVAAVAGQVWSVMADGHNTHLQDTRDVRVAAMDHVLQALAGLTEVCALIAEAVRGLEADGARGKQICLDTFSTATELADTLVRERGLDFRSGHAVSSEAATWLAVNGRAADTLTPQELAEIADRAIGSRVELESEALARAVDPAGFVEIRANIGGPAPVEVARMIEARIKGLANDQVWLEAEQSRIAEASLRREAEIAALLSIKV
jgi:argininosuccinate lyase